MNEPGDLREHLNVPILPDAQVLWTDPSLRKNRGRLRQDESCATDSAAAEMNKMPVVRVSVLARILTHRRNEDPICKRHIANCERIKEARHGGDHRRGVG